MSLPGMLLTTCAVPAAGLDAISGRLVELRARLQAKLMELSGKQDETIAAQKVLGEQLRVVGKEVESTCSQVRQVGLWVGLWALRFPGGGREGERDSVTG